MRWPFGRTAALASFVGSSSTTSGIQVDSWVERSLEQVVFNDVIGGVLPVLSRDVAMRVPAVSRARHLIAGTIANLPIRALVDSDEVSAPYWAMGTDGQLGGEGDITSAVRQNLGLVYPQSPWFRMLWTIDDLLFEGLSCWYATALDSDGRPSRLARIPLDRWDVDEDSGTVVDQDGKPLDRDRVKLIPGGHSGILDFGASTIASAGLLEHTAADVAAHPFRLELHQTTDVTLTKTERRELVDEARAALAANNGVLFTNSASETQKHRLDSGELLVAGRNAAALDVARHASIPAAMLDATSTGASLEYATLQGRNQQWIDYGLVLYMDPIESRLGMDDVVAPPTRIAFDTADLTAPAADPTGPSTED